MKQGFFLTCDKCGALLGVYVFGKLKPFGKRESIVYHGNKLFCNWREHDDYYFARSKKKSRKP